MKFTLELRIPIAWDTWLRQTIWDNVGIKIQKKDNQPENYRPEKKKVVWVSPKMERWSWGKERSSWCAGKKSIFRSCLSPSQQNEILKQICKSENLLTNNSLLVVRELPDVRDDPEQSWWIWARFTCLTFNNKIFLLTVFHFILSAEVIFNFNWWTKVFHFILFAVHLGVWQQMKVTTMQRRIRKRFNSRRQRRFEPNLKKIKIQRRWKLKGTSLPSLKFVFRADLWILEVPMS